MPTTLDERTGTVPATEGDAFEILEGSDEEFAASLGDHQRQADKPSSPTTAS
jgi:hypothetical protein